jgi:hypothetical protein
MPPLLVACAESGGGGGAFVWLITIAVLATWALVTALILRAVRDRTERRLLLGLFIGSIVLGPLIIAAYYAGLFGSDSSIGKLALFLMVPAAIGAVIAYLTGRAKPLRAFLISLWGAVFLISAGLFLFFVAVIFSGGTICME